MNVEEKAEQLINEGSEVVSFLGVIERALGPHLMQIKCVMLRNI